MVAEMAAFEPSHGETLIASVRRALRLVDIVANASRPVPVKVLARRASLSLGTTYNLARTLAREGYLTLEPDGLVLGSRFPALREDDGDGVFLAQVRAALHDVTDGLGVTAYLSRYQDGEIHLIDIVDAVSSPRVELWVGLDSAAHATALGKQILAALDHEERLDYLSRHTLEELTPHTIRDRRVLLRQLEWSRDAALDLEEYAIGYACLAVPVRAPGLTASLAVSLPADRASGDDVTTLAASLRAISDRLSLRLGAARYGQFPR